MPLTIGSSTDLVLLRAFARALAASPEFDGGSVRLTVKADVSVEF